MNEIIWLGIVLICGALLGTIFFGGLQWTILKSRISKRPAILFFCSLLIRTAIVLTGFYFLGRGHWERMLVSLVGFIMARFILTWLILRVSERNENRLKRGADHAPES